MEDLDWDKGLPLDLLSAVAGGRDELKAMRGVCRTWKAGFEASVTKFKVSCQGPILPPGGAFANRFPAARRVDFGRKCCKWVYKKPPMEEGALIENLGRLVGAHITCLVLCGMGEALTDAGMAQLRGLRLTRLDLSHCGHITDAGLGGYSSPCHFQCSGHQCLTSQLTS